MGEEGGHLTASLSVNTWYHSHGKIANVLGAVKQSLEENSLCSLTLSSLAVLLCHIINGGR